jgi:ABC-type nitrate/sulfonate/bicarbonate transport system substrate-binding protein
MSKKIISVLTVAMVLVLAFVTFGCSSGESTQPTATATKTPATTQQGAPDKIRIAMPASMEHPLWIWWYVAEDQGYFAEENLEVERVLVAGTPLTVQFLLAGKAELAWPSPAATLNAYASGYDIVSLYAFVNKFSFEIVAPADGPITEWTADQIRGKTIGISMLTGGEVAMVKGAIANIGLEVGKDVFLKEIGDGSALTISEIQNHRVDAYSSSKADTGKVRAAGIELRNITPSGVDDFPFNTLITTRDYFNNNQDILIRHTRAIAKAVFWTIANPKGAVDICAKYAPEEVLGAEYPTLDFITVFYINPTVPKLGNLYGYQSPEDWDLYQQYLLKAGSPDPEDPITFSEPIDSSKIIDNSLVRYTLDFDLDQVKADAAAYQIVRTQW